VLSTIAFPRWVEAMPINIGEALKELARMEKDRDDALRAEAINTLKDCLVGDSRQKMSLLEELLVLVRSDQRELSDRECKRKMELAQKAGSVVSRGEPF
jgi:hypothetical protein